MLGRIASPALAAVVAAVALVAALLVRPPTAVDLSGGVFVVVPAARVDDAAVRLAVGDLATVLAASLGQTPLIVTDDDRRVDQLPPRALVVLIGGRENRWLPTLVAEGRLTLPSLSDDGYLLAGLRRHETQVVVASGAAPRGIAYAIFRLAERFRLDAAGTIGTLGTFRSVVEPDMQLRLVADPTDPEFPSPADALRWGYNAIAIQPWPALALYDGFDSALYDRRRFPAERAWVEDNRRRAAERIAAAKALHLMVVTPGDVPTLPQQAVSRYGRQVATDVAEGRLCLDRPLTQRLLVAAVNEVLSAFPGIDAVMVRSGENYAARPLVGTSAVDAQCSLSQATQSQSVAAIVSHRQVIETVGSAVVANGKLYIHRAWDLDTGGMHANPAVSAAVLGAIAPAPGLIVSYKHAETDFWRYNGPNPNLLGMPQPGWARMVEFQAAREYEGKGAFPNYLGEVYASGGAEKGDLGGINRFRRAGATAIWVWPRGGGWGGPYPTSDLWNDANRYAMSRLAWDTSLKPEAIARDWATLRFGAAAAPAMTRLLMRSSEAVLKAFYVGDYARRSGPWTSNALWVRDDGIYGGAKLAELSKVLESPPALERALAERRKAVAIVDEMRADFAAARPHIRDAALADEVERSLDYERALFETFEHYLSGAFRYFAWQRTRDPVMGQAALADFDQWRQSWQYYNEVAALPATASPFRNRGMEETVSQMVADIAAKLR